MRQQAALCEFPQAGLFGPAGKLLVMFMMFMGRVGPLTLALALAGSGQGDDLSDLAAHFPTAALAVFSTAQVRAFSTEAINKSIAASPFACVMICTLLANAQSIASITWSVGWRACRHLQWQV